MPSIPQSLLWISLVVLWLFVLVPMLISKRDAVRRTSDVALATRVVNGDAGSRLLKRGGPAAGHRSDPDWKPEQQPVEDELMVADEDHRENSEADTEELQRSGRAIVKVAATAGSAESAEPDYLDVDVVEDSGALPAGASADAAEPAAVAVDGDGAPRGTDVGAEAETSGGEDDDSDEDDGCDYAEDSSGLEPEADARDEGDDEEYEEYEAPYPSVAPGSRRRRFDSRNAAAVSARKYMFRKRVLMAMGVVLVGSATAAFGLTPGAWWICGSATVVTVLYLAYLRRQTRIEEKVRRRRMQRTMRARLGVENTHDRDYDVVPSRLRRPGAVVLEIDDEDPIFEDLDYSVPARNYGWSRELPRAVGQ